MLKTLFQHKKIRSSEKFELLHAKETIKNLQKPVSNFHIIKQTAVKRKHMVYLNYNKTLYHKNASPHLLYFARKKKKSNNL